MKVTKLEIKNIGLIADAVIELNQPLIIFYGDIQAGKTTYLNAVRWVFGGAFPDDIIRHGETEAFIQLTLDNGHIRREFYVARDGSTKARPIEMKLDGAVVLRPVDKIEEFLNPFLLNQDFLVVKNELARKKYFAELFAIDTAALDAEYERLATQAQNDRARLSGYGDIDVTPVPEPPNTATLIADRRILQDNQQREIQQLIEANRQVVLANGARQAAEQNEASTVTTIANLEQQLVDARARLEDTRAYLAVRPVQFETPVPTPAGTPELDHQIEQAAADAVRYAQYQKNQARATERLALEKSISTAERRQNEIRVEKIARLAKVTEESGVAGLAFDAEGSFTYQGTTAGMLSTSQLMELSESLSKKYPPGFGLSLVDRGESLGSSIFKLIERAKTEDKTILATVVGERPAQVPEHVGVFVVTDGKATA